MGTVSQEAILWEPLPLDGRALSIRRQVGATELPLDETTAHGADRGPGRGPYRSEHERPLAITEGNWTPTGRCEPSPAERARAVEQKVR